jgi:cystathionine gamma-synthase
MARHSESALAVAQQLDGHPAVAEVLYPGLPSHPGHEVAARQMLGGFGGMESADVGEDGDH